MADEMPTGTRGLESHGGQMMGHLVPTARRLAHETGEYKSAKPTRGSRMRRAAPKLGIGNADAVISRGGKARHRAGHHQKQSATTSHRVNLTAEVRSPAPDPWRLL